MAAAPVLETSGLYWGNAWEDMEVKGPHCQESWCLAVLGGEDRGKSVCRSEFSFSSVLKEC